MSLSPENAHSMIDKALGLGVVASRRAYQVRSLRFHYHPLSRGDANWVLDGLTLMSMLERFLASWPERVRKTSLLKLLAKVLRPHAGDMALFGRDLGTMPQLRWRGLWPCASESHRSFPLP